MHDFPFDTRHLSEEYIDILDNTYKSLSKEMIVEPIGDCDFDPKNFELFNHYTNVLVRGCFRLGSNNEQAHIMFIQVEYILPSAGRRGPSHLSDIQAWLFVTLNKDFGHVLIRPESIRDRILEFIHHVEVNFPDDKTFTTKYYCVANDEVKAISAMNFNFRNAIMGIKNHNFQIEIKGKKLIMGNQQFISPEQSYYMAEFAKAVCALR